MPFSPGSLTAVKYWLDAGTISGITNGANITAASWVDGSISAHGALATATNSVYRTGAINGLPAVEFDGSTSFCKSAALTITSPKRVFIVAKELASAQFQKYLFDGGTLDEGPIIYGSALSDVNPPPASSNTFEGVGVEFSHTYRVPHELNFWEVYDAIFNGTSSSIQINSGVVQPDSNPGTSSYSAISLGSPGDQTSGFFANLQIAEVIVCDSTLTGPQAAQIKSYLYAKYNIVSRALIICDGNSLTYGTGSSSNANRYPDQMVALLSGGGATWNVINNGVAGETTPQMTTLATTATDNFTGTDIPTVIVGWEVSNDIAAGTSAATCYSNLQAYFSARRTAEPNAKLVVLTCLDRTDLTGPQETVRATVNASIVSGWASFADALVDVAADSRFTPAGSASNPTYYSDTIHLTDAGYAVIAGLVATAVNGLFPASLVLGSQVLDAGLEALSTQADKIYVCSQAPTDFTSATSTYAMGNKNFGVGNVFGAPQTGSPGRYVSSSVFSDGSLTATGQVSCWAVVDSVNSRLLATGPMTGNLNVASGQLFSLGVITIREPGQ